MTVDRDFCIFLFPVLLCRWALYAEGLPYMVDIQDENALPAESRFSFSRAFELQNTIKEM